MAHVVPSEAAAQATTGRTWPALVVTGPKNGSASDGLDWRDTFEVALLDHDVSALEEGPGDGCRVFFLSTAGRDDAARELRQACPDCAFEPVDIPDDNWAARSQASLRAITAGRLIVAPPWDLPTTPPDPEGRLIVIQPSMGFGTGHHATTRLCLEALQQLPLAGQRVVDVGTGSGVLAIAASLLGAAQVVGLDDDPDAVRSARESLALNPAATVELGVADLRESPPGRFDIVLANLTGALLVSAAPHLRALGVPGGRFVLSGFLDVEEAAVLAAFSGCTVASLECSEEWRCVVLVEPGGSRTAG